MNILLIDIDSKLPNLALKKIEKYYADRKDTIVWNFPLARDFVDIVYVSTIFSWNHHLVKDWLDDNKVIIGGSGFDIQKKLPIEIELIKPRINLGFASRGCIRKCPFCIVPEKEGNIKIEGDLLDLWDGKTKDITLLDNNILALPEHFELICQQAKKNKIRLDFNSGLDFRLLTQDIIILMKSISHKEYRFAFDNIRDITMIKKAIQLLQKNNINRCLWYVLVGFNSTFEEDIFRVKFLKQNNQNAYIQRYKTCYSNPIYIGLARWVNQHHIFHGMSWEQFLDIPVNKKYKLAFQKQNN